MLIIGPMSATRQTGEPPNPCSASHSHSVTLLNEVRADGRRHGLRGRTTPGDVTLPGAHPSWWGNATGGGVRRGGIRFEWGRRYNGEWKHHHAN